METISSMELRKVFLSVPVTKADQSIEGLRNLSDDRLNEIFLQTLVSMTDRVYERRLLTLTIQTGRPRPRTLDDIDAIVSLLKENSNLITYMWSEDFHAAQGLKILKVLWQD